MDLKKVERELIGIQQIVGKYSPNQEAMIEEMIEEIRNKPDDEILEGFNSLAQSVEEARNSGSLSAYQEAGNNLIGFYYDNEQKLKGLAESRIVTLENTINFNDSAQNIVRTINGYISDGDNESALRELKRLKSLYSEHRYQFTDSLQNTMNQLESEPSATFIDNLNQRIKAFNEQKNLENAQSLYGYLNDNPTIKEKFEDDNDINALSDFINDVSALEESQRQIRRLLQEMGAD